MRAEQHASFSFDINKGRLSKLLIQLDISLETPAPEPDPPGLGIILLYEPKLPEQLKEAFHHRLYGGVHSGLAIASGSLPNGGLEVYIQKLSIVPLQVFNGDDESIEALGTILEHLTSWMVAALLSGLQISNSQGP